MPEIRKDPVFGRWVIIASERGLRPNEFRVKTAASSCPFCPGNEKETPPAILTLPGAGNDGAWRMRVVANKYPALVPGEACGGTSEGIYSRMGGIGRHEVVIETPRHDAELQDLGAEAVAEVFSIFRDRVRELKKDPCVKYVMIFKNLGENAGASLAHPHSQIVAMPMAPLRVMQEIDGARDYKKERGTCVFCDIVKEERASGKRVIAENGDFIAVEPYASRFSFETWILPKKHASHFEDLRDAELAPLAQAVSVSLGKLKASIPGLSYNMIVHTMPVADPAAEHYHWHIEIMPKLTMVAGFEWGTGFYINTVPPEKAAEILNSGGKYRA